MNEPYFSEKAVKFNTRISNKRYLAKKKRVKEKLSSTASGIEVSRMVVQMLPLKDSQETWLVSAISQNISGKRISCIHSKNGKKIDIVLPPKSHLIETIVIGDFVSIENSEILWIIERKNLLARYKWDNNRFSLNSRVLQSIAANVDYAVIVASAKDPKFQPGFIDRYMVLIEEAGITPIICITKSDLLPISDPILDWYEKKMWIPVVYTSSVSGNWVDNLKKLLFQKTVVFVWKSWVGKSSLTNALLWEEIITTSHVSEKWGQWRHTTTGSKMHAWAENSYVIDTPGIRSLEFLEFGRDELKLYFPDFQKYTVSCKYQDCNHNSEPECGIKIAVAGGNIPEFRYKTYLRLLEEII